MIIPLKEIGVIREARGRDDLLHRMRELSLDLCSVYDPDFATRLWERLAEEFDFLDIKNNVVKPETLKALVRLLLEMTYRMARVPLSMSFAVW